jgi:uncharacterized protein (DUF1330 family)
MAEMAMQSQIDRHPMGQDLLRGVDLSQPVGMLNLLRFRQDALYPPEAGETPCSGAEAYRRYGEAVTPILAGMGASVHLSGLRELIGAWNEWDMAFLVRYPSGHVYRSLRDNPAYKAIVHHRAAAVADSRLLLMQFHDGAPVGLGTIGTLTGAGAD